MAPKELNRNRSAERRNNIALDEAQATGKTRYFDLRNFVAPLSTCFDRLNQVATAQLSRALERSIFELQAAWGKI